MSLLKTFAPAALSLVAALSATFAHAMDRADCENPANWQSTQVVSAQMKAGGQHTYAAGTLVRNRQPVGGMLFTTNDDHTEGYIFRTDAPLEKGPSKMCVYDHFKGIRVLDPRAVGLSPVALIRADEQAGSKACDVLAKNDPNHPRQSCSPYNKALENGAAAGFKVMTQSFVSTSLKDGTNVQNGWMTTLAYKSNGAAVLLSTGLPDGATFIMEDLVLVGYTEYGAMMLKNLESK